MLLRRLAVEVLVVGLGFDDLNDSRTPPSSGTAASTPEDPPQRGERREESGVGCRTAGCGRAPAPSETVLAADRAALPRGTAVVDWRGLVAAVWVS